MKWVIINVVINKTVCRQFKATGKTVEKKITQYLSVQSFSVSALHFLQKDGENAAFWNRIFRVLRHNKTTVLLERNVSPLCLWSDMSSQWRIQNFPKEGANLLICQIFPKTT